MGLLVTLGGGWNLNWFYIKLQELNLLLLTWKTSISQSATFSLREASFVTVCSNNWKIVQNKLCSFMLSLSPPTLAHKTSTEFLSNFKHPETCIWMAFDKAVCIMPQLMIWLCYWRGVGLTLGGMWRWFENFNQFVCRWVVACARYTLHGLHTEKLFLIPMTWPSLIIRSSCWSRKYLSTFPTDIV